MTVPNSTNSPNLHPDSPGSQDIVIKPGGNIHGHKCLILNSDNSELKKITVFYNFIHEEKKSEEASDLDLRDSFTFQLKTIDQSTDKINKTAQLNFDDLFGDNENDTSLMDPNMINSIDNKLVNGIEEKQIGVDEEKVSQNEYVESNEKKEVIDKALNNFKLDVSENAIIHNLENLVVSAIEKNGFKFIPKDIGILKSVLEKDLEHEVKAGFKAKDASNVAERLLNRWAQEEKLIKLSPDGKIIPLTPEDIQLLLKELRPHIESFILTQFQLLEDQILAANETLVKKNAIREQEMKIQILKEFPRQYSVKQFNDKVSMDKLPLKEFKNRLNHFLNMFALISNAILKSQREAKQKEKDDKAIWLNQKIIHEEIEKFYLRKDIVEFSITKGSIMVEEISKDLFNVSHVPVSA